MIGWIADALRKLSLDEFERVINKVYSTYNSLCKIISVNRSEHDLRIQVELTNGEKKLVVL